MTAPYTLVAAGPPTGLLLLTTRFRCMDTHPVIAHSMQPVDLRNVHCSTEPVSLAGVSSPSAGCCGKPHHSATTLEREEAPKRRNPAGGSPLRGRCRPPRVLAVKRGGIRGGRHGARPGAVTRVDRCRKTGTARRQSCGRHRSSGISPGTEVPGMSVSVEVRPAGRKRVPAFRSPAGTPGSAGLSPPGEPFDGDNCQSGSRQRAQGQEPVNGYQSPDRCAAVGAGKRDKGENGRQQDAIGRRQAGGDLPVRCSHIEFALDPHGGARSALGAPVDRQDEQGPNSIWMMTLTMRRYWILLTTAI